MKNAMMLLALTASMGSACSVIQHEQPDRQAACVPAAGATAARPGCNQAPKQAMNLDSFTAVSLEYSSLAPKAASRFLIDTNERDPGLAETLMLHQPRLQRPGDIETAFLFYVINTRNPLLADEQPEVLQRLQRSYRESLLLPGSPDVDSAQIRTLDDLRGLGQEANRSRYGRGDVIPTHLLDFDASSAGYSHNNAAWMAEMAALAYWDKALIERQLGLWHYDLVAEITDEGTETSAFLAGKDEYQVLSFRGTSSLKDFKTDLNILKMPATWADGKVHSGFALALDSVWDSITEQLGDPRQQQKDLWVTGHSLGAALAQLAALRLSEMGYRVRAAYTYGTPRIGNKDFVENYNRRIGKRTFPHINRNDLVTRVPPALLGFRTSAKAQILKFTGIGHTLEPLEEGPDPSPDATVPEAISSIRSTTDFLPGSLRSPSLASADSPNPPPMMNLYSNEFEVGPLDEHGSFEYLFKLACVVLEKELWPIETRRAGMRVGRLDFQPEEGVSGTE